MRSVRVAAVQTGPGGVSAAEIERTITSLGQVDLVVLPEVCHVPYFPVAPDAAQDAEPVDLDGELVRSVGKAAAASRCHVVLPVYLRHGDATANAAVLLGPDGALVPGRDLRGRERLAYHKVHLCDVQFYGAGICESRYFVRGDGPVLWDTPFGRLGILICYDRHFPEAWRTLRVAGADVVCVPIASPASTEPTFVAEMQAMALQQEVFVVVASRAGTETLASTGLTTEYLGRSCVIGPDGKVLGCGPACEPGVTVTADLDPEALARIRRGMPLLEHRRPETYVLEENPMRRTGWPA